LKDEILFISDLHLAIEKPRITNIFLKFLNSRATQAKELYILGDLFDVWVGDDDLTPPNKKIRRHLKNLTSNGTRVYLQQGNRDFLLGTRFCQETGVILLNDHHLLDLYGTKTLLMHGDLLCTDDIGYQKFRALSHTAHWKQEKLAYPLWLRLIASRWYRFKSLLHKRNYAEDILDVNQIEVVKTLKNYSSFRLIHGHTHRPTIHQFTIGKKPAERFVLANWTNQQGSVLCWSPAGHHIETLQT
jgi:UDP-2,3-diacylglucosamine hydrolase